MEKEKAKGKKLTEKKKEKKKRETWTSVICNILLVF